RFVVERVCSKLSRWDASQLSLASRVTLAQSVLLSILSYFTQTMMVPKESLAVYQKIHQGVVVPFYGNPFLSSMIKGDGSWNLDLFRLWVPEEIINKIIGVSPPHPSSGPDRIIWRATLTDSFSLKSIYGKLALKQHLITNAERVRRGFGSSSACGLYRHDYEDVSLNTDGSVRLEKGFATDGGCVRDYNVEWIIGRFERILIQTDNIEAINVIMEDSSRNSNSAIVKRIHHILKRVKQWEIQHIPREDNLIADSLTKTVCTRRLGLRLFEYPTLRV
ncbi:hypothetical protein Golax_003407, partial [Gossypium laxum]|nr:hypothetical protein [Gossypium laxum]